MAIYRLAAAVELALVLLEATMDCTALPIGGGHAQQIGCMFGVAFILTEVFTDCCRLYGGMVRALKRPTFKRQKVR